MATGVRSHGYLVDTVRPFDPALAELLQWIPYMPIAVRKVVLSCAQVRLSPLAVPFLSKEFAEAFPKYAPIYDDNLHQLSRSRFIELLDNVSGSAIRCAVLSMAVRSTYESFSVYQGTAEEERKKGLLKELEAATNVFSDVQVCEYASYFPGPDGQEFHEQSIYYPITPSWVGSCRAIADRLVSTFADQSRHVLFPVVQRKKNMSQETCRRLVEDGFRAERTGSREWKQLRTVDLEVHYWRTGRKVQGECEMRTAWRFNDLKPRVYYCVGGTPYWASRYMRSIAVDLMEVFPVSRKARRMDPGSLTYFIDPEEDLVCWDYSSFTTKLAELKFFVYWLGRYIQDQCGGDRHSITTFDYRLGLQRVNPGDMILAYNEVVNIHAPFSVHRVCAEAGVLDGDVDHVFQENNGMLGVAGNIGLSTTLHGAHILPMLSNSASAVSLGDDALAPKRPDDEGFWPHLSLIGDVHPQKAHTLPAPDIGDEFIAKFVKRRLTRDYHGFSILPNLDVPMVALIFNDIPESRSIRPMSLVDRLYLLIQQTSALLWQINQTSENVSKEELELLQAILSMLYRRFRLPTHGMFPGHTIHLHNGQKERLRMALPCIHWGIFDPRYEDWAEVLYERRPQMYFELPIRSAVPLHINRPLVIGKVVRATMSPLLMAMEDIGVVRCDGYCYEWFHADEDMNRRTFLTFVRSETKFSFRVCQYTVVDEFPGYFEQVSRYLEQHASDPDWEHWFREDEYVHDV